jgi:hypothetical protein
MGSNKELLVACGARLVHGMGAPRLDLNCGCPANTVTGGGPGAAWGVRGACGTASPPCIPSSSGLALVPVLRLQLAACSGSLHTVLAVRRASRCNTSGLHMVSGHMYVEAAGDASHEVPAWHCVQPGHWQHCVHHSAGLCPPLQARWLAPRCSGTPTQCMTWCQKWSRQWGAWCP